ncbi:unnamed protein product [Medioppia subpectinata]|uniref:Uncharacterized protein n=1 Tax=Medioppia subpectinata TaxID=1979941 RepID=A0A7R9KX33_9ACAR|nr:unnamed protein product [Medioppia subpectinata]CAG2111412.1 unnamed protein product [Medioppia subpectinata]
MNVHLLLSLTLTAYVFTQMVIKDTPMCRLHPVQKIALRNVRSERVGHNPNVLQDLKMLAQFYETCVLQNEGFRFKKSYLN